MYFLYVIESEINKFLYVGITNDINKRLKEHNSGKTKSTKGYTPWKLVYSENFENRLDARKKEIYYKSGCGKEYLKSIIRPHSSTDTCLPAGRERKFPKQRQKNVFFVCYRK
jgi:putative endonuclease